MNLNHRRVRLSSPDFPLSFPSNFVPNRSRGVAMPRKCFFTGASTSVGMKRAWRGQAVKKGGFGLKPTGITHRTFKPNLQTLTAVVEGAPKRIKVSTRAIRQGLVIKPLKRKYGYTRQQKGLPTH